MADLGADTDVDPTETIRDRAERALKDLVGSNEASLRQDQWHAIEALAVQHRRALVVQRTGWGKSAVYFVATVLLRAAGAGPTVIISPLLALMRNQIAAAERAGIRAATINSTNVEEWAEISCRIGAGEIDVLLVSPERLNNPDFRDNVLGELTRTAGLLVIDEAHCISDWGHDFRPDYRRIRDMLGSLPEGIPVLATTATANDRVMHDVAEQLGTDVLVQRGDLDRESLRLAVLRLPRPADRLAWLADNLAGFDGSGIIYCLTVSATQEVAAFLAARGHRVAAYSGQSEATERLELEAQLARGEVKALVATSALGMGFDATLGFVINLGAPSSPVAYYQQVGRAGRGTPRADVVLLPAFEDQEIWKYFASLAFPPEQHVRAVLRLLEDGAVLSTAAIEPHVELSRGRLEMMLKVLDVDGAVRRVKGGWTGTGQQWSYERERYERVAEARRVEQQAMLDYQAYDGCRMRFLREQLDDKVDADCGRCDNCGGIELRSTVSDQAVAAATEQLDRPGVLVSPRKMWPTGLAAIGLPMRGRITAGAEEGRVAGRLTDLGVGNDLRALFAGSDAAVPTPVVQAMVATLLDWRPAVDGLVGFSSATRPLLVDSLVDGLSRFLHKPVLGRVAVVDESVPPGAGAMNSARRIDVVSRRFQLRTEPMDGQRILLVDDLIDTGWAMTVTAVRLREAGASAVLPLALASTS